MDYSVNNCLSRLTVGLFLVSASLLGGFPEGTVKGLSADEFGDREAAQEKLFGWAVDNGDGAIRQLLGLWKESEDPEVRERVFRVLRGLSDADYQKGGRPYLGISMIEEPGEADGEGNQDSRIAITEILKGSPADTSELQVGDVIVSLNGNGWGEAGAINKFSASIAGMAPNSEILLLVERNNAEPFETKVTLRRCPVPNLLPRMHDLGKLEADAMDTFFDEWMEEKRKSNQ